MAAAIRHAHDTADRNPSGSSAGRGSRTRTPTPGPSSPRRSSAPTRSTRSSTTGFPPRRCSACRTRRSTRWRGPKPSSRCRATCERNSPSSSCACGGPRSTACRSSSARPPRPALSPHVRHRLAYLPGEIARLVEALVGSARVAAPTGVDPAALAGRARRARLARRRGRRACRPLRPAVARRVRGDRRRGGRRDPAGVAESPLPAGAAPGERARRARHGSGPGPSAGPGDARGRSA